MKTNQANSVNIALIKQLKETSRNIFNRKPDLTYDLEKILTKLNIEIEASY